MAPNSNRHLSEATIINSLWDVLASAPSVTLIAQCTISAFKTLLVNTSQQNVLFALVTEFQITLANTWVNQGIHTYLSLESTWATLLQRASIASILDKWKYSYQAKLIIMATYFLYGCMFQGNFCPTKEGGGMSWQAAARRVTSWKGLRAWDPVLPASVWVPTQCSTRVEGLWWRANCLEL